jgi:hypothetical protein
LISERVACGNMSGVRLIPEAVVVVAVLALGACDGDNDEGLSGGGSSSTTSFVSPLDCARWETAEADLFGDEPEGTYKGAPTPEAALKEYGEVTESEFARVAKTDPAYGFLETDTTEAVFVRTDKDGRRTMAIEVRPASGGGWVARAHVECTE